MSSGAAGLTRSLRKATASLGAARRSPILAKALTASLPASASQQVSRSADFSALAGSAGRLTLVTSQTKAVLSALAEASVLPLGAKATAVTVVVWPLKAASSLPVTTSQRWTVPPVPERASNLRSGAIATLTPDW